jgi:predicted RNA-binding protein
MRKVFLFGAMILFAGSVGVVIAQERLPQASGFGTGVGESSGTGTRSQIWDKNALLERLSQPETVYGRVLAIDIPGHKLHLETGGSSHDEGRAGTGAMSSLTLYLDGETNVELIRVLNAGDDVIVMAREETSTAQPFGTGRKLVRDVTVLRGNEKLAGFGGLGQRPNPNTERGIETNSGGITGGVPNQMMPGEIDKALGFNSSVGEVTGAAPCWQCNPQPGWGNAGTTSSDYGSSEKPQFMKGQ